MADKEIALFRNEDFAGRKYVAAVRKVLAKFEMPPIFKPVELPDFPHHGNIVDWIQAEGAAAEPYGLRQQLARRSTRGGDLSDWSLS